jgi:hypothetical protein
MGVRSNFKSIFEPKAQALKHKTSVFLRFLKLAAGPASYVSVTNIFQVLGFGP